MTEKKTSLVHIGFKADEETVAAIEKLKQAADKSGVVARQSTVIRKAILDAAAALADEK